MQGTYPHEWAEQQSNTQRLENLSCVACPVFCLGTAINRPTKSAFEPTGRHGDGSCKPQHAPTEECKRERARGRFFHADTLRNDEASEEPAELENS